MAWQGMTPTEFIAVVEDDLVDKRKAITADALQAVVTTSPVDDGAYRANHRVTIDGADLGYDLTLLDKQGGETLARGMAVVGEIRTPFGYASVQNNIPYGGELERGTSKQAPSGVYGVAFEAVRAKHSK